MIQNGAEKRKSRDQGREDIIKSLIIIYHVGDFREYVYNILCKSFINFVEQHTTPAQNCGFAISF
jgi:hypothetical protein